MKLLIYGHKGWIGQQVAGLLYKRENNGGSYILGNARVDNTSAVADEIDTVNPTHVLSLIGRTHGEIDGQTYSTIDYLEQPGKLTENIRDNLFSPVSLALLCKEKGIHLTYLGTGCIFTYPNGPDDPGEGFSEGDLPNFTGSGYSTVKGYTDRLMHQLEDTVLNLRIRMPIVGEDNPRNFITKITTYEKICSIPNSMTVLPELLPIALDMLEQGKTGTVNLTNPGVISHNEILEMYKELVDSSFKWKNFSLEEQAKILASERSNNLLSTKVLEEFAPQVRPIKQAVRELLQTYRSVPRAKKEENHMPDNQNVTLLVTGGAGFIGSNFINRLFREYHNINVINFDALYYCGDRGNVDESVRKSPRYKFVHGNLQSLDLLNFLFQSHNITHVVHFAAQSHVQNSFSDAIQYTKDNILGTHNLLEATKNHAPNLERFIHVSTDEVYGESMIDVSEKHKTEQSILCPTNPYAATKAGAELIAQSYNHSFGMPIIVTRGNNVYGPNQYPEKLVPRFIELLKADKPVTIQGDGSCVRAFLHSEDTAAAFIKILQKGTIGEIYNIGCDEGMEYSVMDVAKMIIKRIRNCNTEEEENKWITYIEDRPFNDQRYYISNQKLKDLGWEVTIPFEQGLDDLCK